MSLGERIYTLRTEKNLSQGDLADALEVSRQSISKWETNSSVPELDKLVKLSEIFSVSLDALILDKKQPEAPAETKPHIIYVERSNAVSTRKIVGIVLLCFAALSWLIVALFGDIVAGLVLACPFIACGMICLLVNKNAGLWCMWVVYLFIELYLRFGTAVNWQYVFLPQAYMDGYTMHLIIAWVLFLTYGLLTVITVLRFRKYPPSSLLNNTIAACLSWATYFLARYVFIWSFDGTEIDISQLSLNRFTTSFLGWGRSILLVAALVFTVRLIALLCHKKQSKR